VSGNETDSGNTLQKRRKVWLSVTVVSALALLGALASSLPLLTGKSSAGATEQRQRPSAIPVRAARAQRGDLVLNAHYTGELDAQVAELASQVTGRLDSVKVDIGDRVKKGQLLARIDASMAGRQLAEAHAQTKAARAAESRAEADLDAARVELARGKSLAQSGLVSQKTLDELEARTQALEAEAERAQAQREQSIARVGVLGQTLLETRIKAPFDGAVAERFLDPGALTQPGTRIVRLVRSGPLRVRFRAPERDLGRLTLGMPLAVTTQATGERRFEAKVTRVSAEVSRIDRSAVVEGMLEGEVPALRPGMYAEVDVTLGNLKGVVLVPSEALLEKKSEGKARTYRVVVVEGQTARSQVVRILGSGADTTAVEGITEGAVVVTMGQDTLRDGQQVRVVEKAEL
jgi:RND family efflux transporter MFP subunit